jgi:hypothetical protein
MDCHLIHECAGLLLLGCLPKVCSPRNHNLQTLKNVAAIGYGSKFLFVFCRYSSCPSEHTIGVGAISGRYSEYGSERRGDLRYTHKTFW